MPDEKSSHGRVLATIRTALDLSQKAAALLWRCDPKQPSALSNSARQTRASNLLRLALTPDPREVLHLSEEAALDPPGSAFSLKTILMIQPPRPSDSTGSEA